MNKAEAIKEAIEKRKEQNEKIFVKKIEGLIWDIESKSQQLRDLKKELTELTHEEISVPDVSGCIGVGEG